jgi:hypothetical protein
MKKIILLLFILPLYLFSQDKTHDGYLYYLNQYASYKDDKMQITINYDVKIHWKFWTLMGEPVMVAQMIWAPTLVQKQINGIDTRLNVETNKELLEKLRVYEFIVDAKLKQSVNSAYVLSSLKTLGEVQIDTGVGTYPFTTKLVSNILDVNLNAIENQFKSYNVAGSKDWDKLLKIGNTFASKQKAIESFKQDKILFDAGSVVSAKVDFTSLATHYTNTQAQLLKDKEIEKQKKTQDAQPGKLTKSTPEETVIKDKYGNIYKTVKSPYTGKIWLDRNLGASRVCQSYDDKQCYGDYFQWGRDADGHEKQSSSTTRTLSNDNTPNHNKFIANGKDEDWIDSKNSTLWEGSNAINNPCPIGFKVPTKYELIEEITNKSVVDRKSVFQNFLKLPLAGYRDAMNGNLDKAGESISIWVSNDDKGVRAYRLSGDKNDIQFGLSSKVGGKSVRCLKD